MSTESGNTGRDGTNGSTEDSRSAVGPDGGRLRDRSDRLAPADETQVLPTGPAAADDGSTRALPLSHTKDPHADNAYDDDGYQPEGAASRAGRRADTRAGARADARAGTEGAAGIRTRSTLPDKANREALLAMEKERFGGMKFGAAFFGWLTATGMVVLLSALAAAIGAAFGFSTDSDLGQSLDQAAANQSAGVAGAVILLAILLLAYFAGGYVAGRMARFNGFKQGLAVWIWALIAGVVVVVLGLIFGNDIRSITQLNTVAPLPEDLDGATAALWIAVAATLAATLIGSLLGGLAGMRFHRRIDRADYSDAEVHA